MSCPTVGGWWATHEHTRIHTIYLALSPNLSLSLSLSLSFFRYPIHTYHYHFKNLCSPSDRRSCRSNSVSSDYTGKGGKRRMLPKTPVRFTSSLRFKLKRTIYCFFLYRSSNEICYTKRIFFLTFNLPPKKSVMSYGVVREVSAVPIRLNFGHFPNKILKCPINCSKPGQNVREQNKP